MSQEQRDAIGELPRGHGILGLLIDHPQPLRLEHLKEHPRDRLALEKICVVHQHGQSGVAAPRSDEQVDVPG